MSWVSYLLTYSHTRIGSTTKALAPERPPRATHAAAATNSRVACSLPAMLAHPRKKKQEPVAHAATSKKGAVERWCGGAHGLPTPPRGAPEAAKGDPGSGGAAHGAPPACGKKKYDSRCRTVYRVRGDPAHHIDEHTQRTDARAVLRLPQNRKREDQTPPPQVPRTTSPHPPPPPRGAAGDHPLTTTRAPWRAPAGAPRAPAAKTVGRATTAAGSTGARAGSSPAAGSPGGGTWPRH